MPIWRVWNIHVGSRCDSLAGNLLCGEGLMRLPLSLVSLLFLCAGAGAIAQTSAAPTCAGLHLVPAVRECTYAPFSEIHKIPVGKLNVLVSSEKDGNDLANSALEDLRDFMQSRDLNSGSAHP